VLGDIVALAIGGLTTGAIYALLAAGFALVWQTSAAINFAQGEFVMLPAFLVIGAMSVLHLPFPLALALGFVVSVAVLGLLFKRMLVDPMLRHGTVPLVIATIALGTVIKEGVKLTAGPLARPFPALVTDRDIDLGVTVLSLQSVVVLAVALAVVTALQLFLGRTRTGRRMQATAQNPTVARLLGVPVERMILYTFLINAALTALASFLITPIYLAKFTNGEQLGIAAFVAAVVGGFNQVRGAILGGFLLGIVDNLAATYISTSYRAVVPLLLLILVILFRPHGLLGRAEERVA
jgi:branched-chain amino acid transport system permease protein